MSVSHLFKSVSVITRRLNNAILVKNSTLNPARVLTFPSQTKAFASLTSVLYSDNGENRQLSEGEQKLTNLLRERFPLAKTIDVTDISGGCGSMYQIIVESVEFKNIRKVKQHQMVNDTLQKQIRNEMHGLRIHTAVPDE
jgi:stress-induced morphogen